MPVTPNYILGTTPPTFAGTYQERNTLRIYDVDNTGRLSVDVIFHHVAGVSLVGPHIEVNRREGDDVSYPTFGELTFNGPCYTAPTGNVCREAELALEIVPSDPTIRYYPMLSTTNNTTQYVTVRGPQ
jgi:hypothetical protein